MVEERKDNKKDESAIEKCPKCKGLMERHFAEGDYVGGANVAQWVCLDCGHFEASLHVSDVDDIDLEKK